MPPETHYVFREMTAADLPLMADWLVEPHLVRWWGEPVEQLALITDDLADPLMDQRIVTLDGQAIGYVQHYPCHAWGAPHLAGFPPGTLALDTFVGPESLLGQGHGTAFLRQRAAELLAQGAPAVVIDPDPGNERAVRAYRRAGFVGTRVATDLDGAPALVLEFRPDPR